MAIGAIEYCKAAGLRVPEDVSIVGFDDIPVAALLSPRLTTVSQPAFDMGYRATTLLLELIKGDAISQSTSSCRLLSRYATLSCRLPDKTKEERSMTPDSVATPPATSKIVVVVGAINVDLVVARIAFHAPARQSSGRAFSATAEARAPTLPWLPLGPVPQCASSER